MLTTCVNGTASNRVGKCFHLPLDRAGVDWSLVKEEWDDIVDYSKQYINLMQDDYKIVCWKLFDSKKWSNFMAVVKLLFCLLNSNGWVKRVFSFLKFIKTNQRTCLKEDTFDYLMKINAEVPLEE